MDVQTNHRRAGVRRGVQGRVVGQAQIIAKPDDDGRGARHAIVVDISWGACVTAVSSTAALAVANWLAPKI
ncbi:hypothetical protein [Bradyrhizobium sp. Ash2021]|uniref:hypothetical protein n=1 Tax=Bradyrhizobium sp. Ash2021 TaxID=2954771 RepID=UPI0028153760|nr:hypothetical protein [Bradyrhizobium sp. Ash2021]WMT79353.1 hypothetical protein NL528_27290 [Bradyrhizobium sp. Ash2021]